ncbi:hypothetical protein FRC17_008945 [Serendipita sp. 399]|nr:hypothetical protein FRC17_008945 [Serendipita sp. 399]
MSRRKASSESSSRMCFRSEYHKLDMTDERTALSSAPSTPRLQHQERVSIRQAARNVRANETNKQRQSETTPAGDSKESQAKRSSDAPRRTGRTGKKQKQKTEPSMVGPSVEEASHTLSEEASLPEPELPSSNTTESLNHPSSPKHDPQPEPLVPDGVGVDVSQPPDIDRPHETVVSKGQLSIGISNPSSYLVPEIDTGHDVPSSEPEPPKSLKRRRLEKGTLPPPKKVKKETKKVKIAPPAPGTIERQIGSCISSRYAGSPRCLACVAKKTGEPCRFRDVRSFVIGPSGLPEREPLWHGSLGSDAHNNDIAEVPLEYNRDWFEVPHAGHIRRVKISASRVLLPILRTERDVLMDKAKTTIQRKREIDVRVTCDRCLTSIFSTSFICTLCGREFCIDCHARLEGMADQSKEVFQNSLFVTCGSAQAGKTHNAEMFRPISRLSLEELQSHIAEIEALLHQEPVLTAEDVVPVEQMERVTMSDPSNATADIVGSLDYRTFQHSELTEDTFQELWKDGQTMVVTGLLEKMSIQWTPEYFIQNFGSQACWITDCDTEKLEASKVDQFFSQFGHYEERKGKILKLKDWPPSADFKWTFPALFDDFQNAVPAPNYTRRDGFYNISSHLPVKVVAPDMGPKMYNAFASREDGYGSTRLHMDMADAVNIMLYAAPPPDQQVGVAVWDIYPSKYSSDIRTFLKEEFPVETSPVFYIDPIHSQHFYLTPALRKKLFEKYGVKSWRIWQKPGDAVFIPAGCAHQVCNLADCVKVAVDFVSPENLDRCSQLTQEFRNENERVTWKDDILQLLV